MHVGWPTSKWHNILWSDESKIVLFGSSGHRIYERRTPNSSYKPQYTLKTVKRGGPKINIWAYFFYYGVGPIYKIDGIMDQNIYLEILQNTMLSFAEEEMPLKCFYMQDNDPRHTNSRAKSWFMENCSNRLACAVTSD